VTAATIVDPEVLRLVSEATRLYRSGAADAAIVFATRTCDRALDRHGWASASYAAAVSCLASIQAGVGNQLAGIALTWRAILLERATLGEADPNVGTSWNNLAALYLREGDLDRAEAAFGAALDVFQRAGVQPEVWSTCLHSIGTVLYLRGKLEAARDTYLRVIDLRRAGGAETPELADSLNNLGDVQLQLGTYREAAERYEEATRIWRRQSHVHAILGAFNQARALHLVGDFRSAVPIYAWALDRFEERGDGAEAVLPGLRSALRAGLDLARRGDPTPRPEPPRARAAVPDPLGPLVAALPGPTGQTLGRCVRAYANGDFAGSVDAGLEASRSVLRHDLFQLILLSLAGLGRWELVARLREPMLAVSEILPREHAALRVSFGVGAQDASTTAGATEAMLGQLEYYQGARLRREGRKQEARAAFNSCIARRRITLEWFLATVERPLVGAEDLDVRSGPGDSLADLDQRIGWFVVGLQVALREREVGRLRVAGAQREALQPQRQIVAMLAGLPIARPKEQSAAENNLADLHYSLGEYAEAEPHYRRSLEWLRQDSSADEAHLADVLENLGNLEERLDRLDDALVLHEEALAIRRRLAPDGSPGLALGLLDLARLHVRRRQARAAADAYREAAGWIADGLRAELAHLARELVTKVEEEVAGGRLEEARTRLVDARGLWEALRGERSDVHSRYRLGLALQNAGDYRRAETLLAQVLDELLANLGEESLDVAYCRTDLAESRLALAQLDAAESLLEVALPVLRGQAAAAGNAVRAMAGLAEIRRARGDLAGAQKAF
jgi:tetratricopeptide (TPR) repeat protein